MVDLFISVKKGQYTNVLAKIKKKKLIIATANRTLNQIVLNYNNLKPRSNKFKIIKSTIDKMTGVESAVVIKGYLKAKNANMKESLSNNTCRLVFDIDSTITRGGSMSTIHPSISPMFQEIQDKGIWIYAATGRSVYDLIEITHNNPIQKTSIAENGGIILGFNSEGYIEYGNKTEPNKILTYLQKRYKIKEDMKQGERITEVIFLKSDVTLKQIQEAEKATKAKITIHQSQNLYHISKAGVNKGSAILELGKRLKWGNVFKIAIGDSQMDVSMFEVCDYSFAPENADDFAKESCTEVLVGNYEKAITNLHNLIMNSN